MRSHAPPARRCRALPPAAAVGLAVATLAGCQTYAPRPLDPAAHRAQWAARSPDAAGVAEFARRLAAPGEPAPFDTSDGLSLAEAEAVALFFNPRLRVARLRAGVAAATAENAGLWDDPTLDFDGERILAGVDHPWVVGATIGLTIPISGSLSAERDRADAEHRAALARVAQDEWEVRSRLRAAWLEWSAHTLRAQQTREFLDELDAIAAVAARLEEAGEMPRTESRLFRLERLARQGDLRLHDARARESELALRALMGLTPDAQVALVPTLARPPVATPDSVLDEAIEARSPVLAVLREEYAVAELTLRREIREQYPDITIGPGIGEEDGDSRALLAVSLPIPLWNRNRQGVAEAAAQRELARAEYEAAVESLAADLAAAAVRAEALAAQRQEIESLLVPLVDEQDQEITRLARLGEFDALLTLETLVRRHETKLRLIDARLEEALAAARIEELLGPPPPPSAPAAADADADADADAPITAPPTGGSNP